MAPKKSPTATVDYVNFTVNQAIDPLEKRVASLEENSHADSTRPSSEGGTETIPPSYVYQKNESATGMTEPTEDNPEGVMSDEEYLTQVFPDLPKWLTKSPDEHFKIILNYYRDRAIGKLCVEEVGQIMKGYLPSIKPQIGGLLKAEAQLYIRETKAEAKLVFAEIAQLDDRIKKLSDQEEKFGERLDNLETQQRRFRQDYDRAVTHSPFEKCNTGLFIYGRNILPVWFIILIITVLIIFCVKSTLLILSQQSALAHQKSQIELLLQRESTHKPSLRKG